jgi:outer membrane protein assembly factor BamB
VHFHTASGLNPCRKGFWSPRLGVMHIIWLLFLVRPAAAMPQEQAALLRITPSTVVVTLGEAAVLNVVDVSGRPYQGASWSVDYPIAELYPSEESIEVRPNHAGRAILTATVGTLSATATISVIEPKDLVPTTILWSVDPWPGYKSLFLRQSVPTADGPYFFDVEWSEKLPAIVRGLRSDGRQIWMSQLHSMASPETLKRKSLPAAGKTVAEDGAPVNLDDLLLLEGGGFVAVRNSQNAKQNAFPPAGRTIFVHDCGDDFGGLVFLERGSSADFLVDLDSQGSEAWRYRSAGRLVDSWTVNFEGDIGVVEMTSDPPSSSLLVINGKTGEVRFRVPFPNSSTTIKGIKCAPGKTLTNIRPSQAGAPFTSVDGNIYLQVAIHNESEDAPCPTGSYTFDNTLHLVQVTPAGEVNWRVFEQVHSDSTGTYVAQPRVFAGESIPDGLGGVLAAWTYYSPGSKEGEKPHPEARLSRLSPSDQHDFTLPMPGWNADPTKLFAENMVLGDDNILYATNGHAVVRFDIPAGDVKWVRQPPSGTVEIQFATAGGGLLVSNVGRLGYFDPEGRGILIPWTVEIPNSEASEGLVQFDLFDHTPVLPVALREIQLYSSGKLLGVEEGAPFGRGGAIMFFAPYLLR